MSSDGLDSMRRNGASTDAPGGGPEQKASAPRLMRTVTLATVGIMAFGVDALSEFARTSLARGQEMEAGAHRLVARYESNAKIQAKAAAPSRDDLAKQAAGQPAGPMQPTTEGEHDNGVSSTAAEEN